MEWVQIRNQKIEAANHDYSFFKKTGLAILAIGLLFLLIALGSAGATHPLILFLLGPGLISAGSLFYIISLSREKPAGIKNDNSVRSGLRSRGIAAWLLAVILTSFYTVLYWFPAYLQNWIRMLDPLAVLITKQPADQWFMYGTFYTFAVLIMGVRMIVFKYRHNRYHQIRTLSIMFFQLIFAYLLPFFMKSLNQPDYYFSYFWPLKYDYLFPGSIDYLLASPGGLGVFLVFWGVMMSFLATPLLTYFFGKRWYCSWVCGCGGLANTAGDPFRHLSDKSLKAWKIERWMIHAVLVFAVFTTLLLWINSFSAGQIFGNFSHSLAGFYGFLIGAVFAGLVGVGFYPLLGTRVWCRFGCPLAAILGLIQKFYSRFRITTNGGQCISCGNCSTYCEMGIEVRAYAQRGQNIVRASCVGCGVCAAVCPRGVLKLENGPHYNRYN